jgi:hypothetical protein
MPFVQREHPTAGLWCPLIWQETTKDPYTADPPGDNDDPGSGKIIGCLLKERELRRKSKVGPDILNEKLFKSKIKKSGASRKALTAAWSLSHLLCCSWVCFPVVFRVRFLYEVFTLLGFSVSWLECGSRCRESGCVHECVHVVLLLYGFCPVFHKSTGHLLLN